MSNLIETDDNIRRQFLSIREQLYSEAGVAVS
jgi:hypothetical protein